MNRFARNLLSLGLLAVTLAGPALAQSRAPAAPIPLQPPSLPGQEATRSQPIMLQAGTGLLLRLPSPAATVMSADPNVARVQPASPTSLFVMGAAPGRTTVLATSDTGDAIVQYDVTVTPGANAAAAPAAPISPAAPLGPELLGGLPGGAPAAAIITPQTAAQIQASIGRLVPGAFSVRATAAGTRVVLTGSVPNAAAAQQAEAIARGYAGAAANVLDEMEVLGSIQVNVRVRIAEIDRTVTRQLGFNWQVLGNGSFRFGLLTGAGSVANTTLSGLTTGLSGAAAATVGSVPYSLVDPRLPLGLAPFQSAPSAPYQLGAGYSSRKWDINGVIDALAADQLVTILAEPNLTAQSGETASFLAGGEFPVPVAGSTSNGTATITVEFKQFGVSLAVVPTVLSPTRLNLRVRPEVSQLSTQGAVSVPISGGVVTIPALTVRRAETTVELGSGQSFAIAGLLQKTSTDVTSALPGIGELPVLGALFKSNNFERGQSELVIIVTPYLVKPAPNPDAFRAPTDGFRPATDLDRILLGHQMAPGASGAPLDAGFILK
jgi:pilus assembly protein CpaC